MLYSILNKSWKQCPTKQFYSHLPPISKTIQVRRTRHVEDELMRNNLLWTPTHWRASVSHRARTYLNQLCADTGWSLKDLLRAMNDRDEERERESGQSVLSVLFDDDVIAWNIWNHLIICKLLVLDQNTWNYIT